MGRGDRASSGVRQIAEGRFGSPHGSCGSVGSTHQLVLGLGVRGAADLRHHRDADLAGGEATEPHGNVAWRLGADGFGERAQPRRDGRGLVVDDVVDAWLPCSIAATVAAAASSMWTNDQTPRPSPTEREASLADRPESRHPERSRCPHVEAAERNAIPSVLGTRPPCSR